MFEWLILENSGDYQTVSLEANAEVSHVIALAMMLVKYDASIEYAISCKVPPDPEGHFDVFAVFVLAAEAGFFIQVFALQVDIGWLIRCNSSDHGAGDLCSTDREGELLSEEFALELVGGSHRIADTGDFALGERIKPKDIAQDLALTFAGEYLVHLQWQANLSHRCGS